MSNRIGAAQDQALSAKRTARAVKTRGGSSSKTSVAVITQFVETAVPAIAEWVVDTNLPPQTLTPSEKPSRARVDSERPQVQAIQTPTEFVSSLNSPVVEPRVVESPAIAWPTEEPPTELELKSVAPVVETPTMETPSAETPTVNAPPAEEAIAIAEERAELDEAPEPERISIPVSEAAMASAIAGPHWRRGARSGQPSLKALAGRTDSTSEPWPALEVEQFLFPSVCQRLLEKHREPLVRHAEQLATHASAGVQVVAVVGCRRAEGRSTLIAALAKLLSEMDVKLAVVDADFQRPCLGPMLGINVEAGIEQVLKGESTLSDVLIASLSDGFTLAPLRPHYRPASRLATNLRGAVLFGELREHYDLILVDAGPCAETMDHDDLVSWLAATRVDAVELAYSEREGAAEQTEFARRALAEARIKVTGLIESFSSWQRPTLRVLSA